ncbi:MAG: hypothetical protein M3Z84_07435 [Actinomycetota bacterium]|nr:hypothetical protein [Actinomycetota bacterium]
MCGGDIQGSTPGSKGAPKAVSGAPSDKVYQPVEAPATGPNGESCTATRFIEVPPGSPELPASVGRDFGNIANNPPPCPAAPGAPAESPAQVAARYWEEVPLPSPRPAIAPGWAISGKLAYLETQGERSHTYYNDTPLGRLEIVATGRYEVDWGDGTGPQTFDVEGEPWPNGRITHDYQWAGKYNVVVTEHWSATWHLGGSSGNLRRLRTEGRIDDFEVRQIQAVRYR